ncbi:MAG: glycoside hydrolase family 57 protein [Deltaproteobacteria bacterium]|jgi:alpha-amylase/alpha-mannosidase (GH57 family)|nr:glycoside hydrolase family 57 protein [Deltaproteobacteria bacterium]MCL5880559.1 glycoside hydrolase family 57 protein [Deltaproteobacteria bacterium]
MNSVNVLFLWHFHQPYYKDNFTGEILMPWARLHATKDYYFMGAVLKNFPKVHATFNYSPSLISQLDEYNTGYRDALGKERFLNISNKKLSELSEEDKLFIIEKFFPACSSSNNFLEKSNRFKRLYYTLKDACARETLGDEEKIELFSSQDYIDIIVLFNMLWIDPVSINSDEFLTGLKNKDKNFTEFEKDKLINEKIPGILNRIFPLLTELAGKGQIELSASPYYHPILPLLCDTNIAGFHGNGSLKLPQPFRHPEDADYQIKSAINYFSEKLNYKVEGMWPSEGSVSEKTLKLFIDNNIKWIATDEEILSNSIGLNFADLNNRKLLYRPYAIKRDNGYLYMFFRDKGLSDLIGFKYSSYKPGAAADDLINNIKNIAISLQNYNENGLAVIPIILDGENAWEYYKNNGYDFFNYLYEGLSNEENARIINTMTVSGYLGKLEKTLNAADALNGNGGSTDSKTHEFLDVKWKSPQDFDFSKIYNIPTIYPGSWINHNFRIWIGDSEDNKAWDLLSKTRDYLIDKSKLYAQRHNTIQKQGKIFDDRGLRMAWEQIYISEGSDYNWWYGEDRTSGIDEEYDQLYRTHLINVYKFLNDNPPDDYYIPIIEEKRVIRPRLDMVSFINPKIDGFIDNYFEWLGSAVYFPSVLAGKAMAHTDRFIRKLFYGFNETTFFMRFDFLKKEDQDLQDKILKIEFINPAKFVINQEFYKKNSSNLSVSAGTLNDADNSLQKQKYGIKAVFKNVLEMSVPISLLNVSPLNPIDFYVTLTYKNNPLEEIERFPVNGYFEAIVPGKNFEIINWLV